MNIRRIIKEEIDDFEWVSQHMDSVPDDDETLVVYLTYGVEYTRGLERAEWSFHGNIPQFINENGDEFVIGTEDEYIEGLYEYYKSTIDNDDLPLDGWNSTYVNPRDWIRIPDGWIDDFCRDESQFYVDDLETNEIVVEVNTDLEYNDLVEQHYDLEQEIQFLDSNSDEFETLQDSITQIELKLHDLIEWSINQLKMNVYRDMKDEISDDPITYLKNRFHMDTEGVIRQMGFELDSDGMARHLTQYRLFGEMNFEDGKYTTQNVGNQTYYIMKVV